MALYGLRKSKDIDCISAGGDAIEDDGNVSSHESELNYYPSLFEKLIQEHNNYLLINGVKFLTLDNLIKFKIKRHEWYKDYIDLCIMLFGKKLNKARNNFITYLYFIPRRNLVKLISRWYLIVNFRIVVIEQTISRWSVRLSQSLCKYIKLI